MILYFYSLTNFNSIGWWYFMARESNAEKLKKFDDSLQKELNKAMSKNSCRHDKESARWMLACCVRWGNYSLKDLIEMRLKMDKDMRNETDITRISAEYKLLFCLEALSKYYHEIHHYIFRCSVDDKEIDVNKIQESCHYITNFIDKLNKFPLLSDELIEQSQNMLGKSYPKIFFNRLYKKANSTRKKKS